MAATDTTILDDVSPSTLTALQFAHASAAVRNPASPLIDGFDVLLGIALAHPGTSPAQRCFEHFQLTIGDIRPDDRLNADRDELNGVLRSLPADWVPQLDDETTRVLDAAHGRAGSDGVVHLRHLWFGLISAPTGVVPARLSLALSRKGVTLGAVVEATEQWLRPGNDANERHYGELLETRLPFHARPLALARYNGESGPGAGDLLQLGVEVDAFAYLLASRELRPPLAIGLFGDWGSGKSFFMESVRDRVAEILVHPAVAGAAQAETPFWKHIVQIDFNAWHYSEGDLLASLVNHLFTELERQSANRSDDAVVVDRDSWLHTLTQVTVKEAEAQQALAEKRRRVDEAQATLVHAEAQEAAAKAQAEHQPLGSAALDVASAVGEVLDDFPLGKDATAADARAAIDLARGEIRRSRALEDSLWGSPRRIALTVALLASIPVLVLVTSLVAGWAESALTGVAAIGGQVVAALLAAGRWMARRNDRLEAARAKVEAEHRVATEQAARKVAEERGNLETARVELVGAEQVATDLAERRTDIAQRMEEPTYQVIQRFIHERLEAGTYRERLGLHAVVRQDLKRLADYIREQNKEAAKERTVRQPSDDEPSERAIGRFNRIILYIDDLDRCPDEKVVAVLQAVHLLLAFELFVVVVAVDDRWLSHALETAYPVLARPTSPSDPAQSGDHPGPSDYLEKIFQIPFRVRPLGEDGKRRMIDGLLGGQVRVDGSGGGGGGDDPPPGVRLLTDREDEVLRALIQQPSRDVSSAAEELSLTPAEFELLQAVAPMLGATPRAVKRFVNLYQLVKMLDKGEPSAQPPDHQVTALILGLDEGRPDLATKLRALGANPLDTLEELRPITELDGAWGSVTGKRFSDLDDTIRRFQFPESRP